MDIESDIAEKDGLTKGFIGFVAFCVIFIVIIPIILLNLNMPEILEGYMPNLDLIALVITKHGGPFQIWQKLYPLDPVTIHGETSQIIINYIALLGITYIISREVHRSGSIAAGWSKGLVMLLMTYLLPNNFISWFMDTSTDSISNSLNLVDQVIKLIVGVLGLSLTATIIISEAYILHTFKSTLTQLAKKILTIPKLFIL